MASLGKETHDLVEKLVVSARGDFVSPFCLSPPKARPVLDLTVPLRVLFLREMKEVAEESPPPFPPLTSVPLRLLQQRAPCQTEG